MHAKREKMRTWFGPEAVVEIEAGFRHRAGLGRFVIPHPPVINWLLRLRLPRDVYERLGRLHEFGHLQSAPVAVLYGLVMTAAAAFRGGLTWWDGLWLALGSHAAWEMMAEAFTIKRAGAAYRQGYANAPLWPRVLFWLLTAGVAAFAWRVVLK